ncbi:uncharacterized protein K441DRAFT_666302 [Cenococcum geophilum 1.58]|uniref:uncharacterized protein n=1 Tax=Cenococcum geophilum 1.58 TaxID=794803 RepID=UPI003590198B|nr:hypothetical protein K441DRAFT_666302 [Cenococcum geophilum 1.58]
MFYRPSVWCSIGASLGSLDLIWRQAYIKALVFASWSFERLSGFGDGPLLAAVGLVPSLCLPSILVSHHQYIQASFCSGSVLWHLALALCSGISLWLCARAIALARLLLRRHMRSLRCGG